MRSPFNRTLVCTTLVCTTLVCTTFVCTLVGVAPALAAGRGPGSYGISPGNGAVVPLNAKLWAMDDGVDVQGPNGVDPPPNVTRCEDSNGDLTDCFGPLVSLEFIGALPFGYYERRFFENAELDLVAGETVGFWVTDDGYSFPGVRWAVGDTVDSTPPPAPIFQSGRVDQIVDINCCGPEDIPDLRIWFSMIWDVPLDDFGIAYLELQTLEGHVGLRAFPRNDGSFSISIPNLTSGSFRAVAVDYAGNRSEPSLIAEVVDDGEDPYYRHCSSSFDLWCHQLFPDGIDAGTPDISIDAGTSENNDDAGATQPSDAGTTEAPVDAGPSDIGADAGSNQTERDAGTTDAIADAGGGGGDETCACVQASKQTPLWSLLVIAFGRMGLRRRTRCRRLIEA